MRSILVSALLLLPACGLPSDPSSDAETSSTTSPLRPRCPADDVDCDVPRDPPDSPPRPGKPPSTPGSSGDPACQAVVTGSVSASPSAAAGAGVPMGTPVTLSWDVQLPTTCAASGPITLGGTPVAASGSMVVKPAASRSYPLRVGSRQIANVLITTVLPTQVRITANTQEQRALFKQAAETPGRTVLLKHDLELDISAYATSGVRVAAGVTIASEAPPAGVVLSLIGGGAVPDRPYTIARDARHLGPKLYSTLRPAEYLLLLDGDNIALRGFRLFGPDMAMTDGFGRGIVVNSKIGIEIDRLELAGFSESAFYVKDPENRNNAFTDINVHDSFFHHNQRAPGGNGYGVVTKEGAKVLIRHNVFDFNRHAIASGGQSGTGYWADENLVLKGGGHHEGVAGVTWRTHIFDVHGTGNCGVGSIFSDSQWNCGLAGDQYFITRNAFQYSAGLDFKLRGTPESGAYLTQNVFPHDDSGDAYHQNETGMRLLDNTLGKDSFGTYGVCDFDGDGTDDLFLATGRTWWFSSGGKNHWTYLNSQTEELGQIGLGDFNHDGRCDVLRERDSSWELSSGGTGVFTRLPAGFSGPMSQLRFADFDGDGYTDVFQRAPSGQWYAYMAFDAASPQTLQSSSLPIESLRFGDFDGDRRTDVLAISAGVWSWSRGANTAWAPLNTRYSSLGDVLMIANVDGLPGDDVIRFRHTSSVVGQLEVSSAGRGPWTKLVGVTWPIVQVPNGPALQYNPRFFAGRFGGAVSDSVLQLDTQGRFTRQFSSGQTSFLPHSLYAH